MSDQGLFQFHVFVALWARIDQRVFLKQTLQFALEGLMFVLVLRQVGALLESGLADIALVRLDAAVRLQMFLQ